MRPAALRRAALNLATARSIGWGQGRQIEELGARRDDRLRHTGDLASRTMSSGSRLAAREKQRLLERALSAESKRAFGIREG
jgi:hypothetical protein